MLDLSALDNEFSGMTRSDILRALLEAAGDGYADFTDVDDNRGRLVASFADDDAEGHWVTMEGEHVFLKGGQIEKGPSNLVGKSPSDLPPRSSGEKDTHEKTLAEHLGEARAAHKAAVESAHGAGKPVADKVLKDYPHLQPDKPKAPPKSPAAGEPHPAVASTKQLYDSMSGGSKPHGGSDALRAKVDAHMQELAKLSKVQLDEVWHQGLGHKANQPNKVEMLKAIRYAIISRAGAYDRVDA